MNTIRMLALAIVAHPSLFVVAIFAVVLFAQGTARLVRLIRVWLTRPALISMLSTILAGNL